MKSRRSRVMVGAPGLYTYGAMRIGGIIREAGFKPQITRNISDLRGDTIFLSLYSTLHLLDPVIKDTVLRIQQEGGTCIIGGPVSSGPEMVLGELHPDLVVCGEGEESVSRIIEGNDFSDCPNCAYLEKNEIIKTSQHRVEDITFPLPLIPEDIATQDIRGAQTYIETHRGCFGRCGFCQVPRVFGRRIRSRTLEEILTEVRAFQKKGVRKLALIGGTGSLYRSRDGEVNSDAFISLLEGISSIMGPKNVSCPDIRADCLTEEVLEAVRAHTIGWIFFGVESGSEKVLDLMQKGIPIDKVRDAVEQCRQYGVKPAGSFITGYPGEEEEDFQITKDIMEELCLDDVFISIAEPIPSTPLAKQICSQDPVLDLVSIPHTGDYAGLHLSEAEARAFDLMLHSDVCRPVPRMTQDTQYKAYLKEARKQGTDIRNVTHLLRKYYSG
ncbi:TIGR04014 family B12-binding domain/radical SAM domain-containing protein [Methanospirillum sp. J.3.6.1-F.2.7.3]|uniref:TIGR04014 family B12-binding domain/radical SAM domain-containing protein n=3 Tax=Methanospirillum TaxID=2202 RepID=A0A8E7ELH9_9EURY|nr:TIGR04014 family B12-binding domain/radical SAM domain-containing protein [Methanospirillum sp. J.3.6.1-F.2.7.3]QXO96437.1 TIGR04014 family B12-binding domain/radical SAM domain-containing protein [Methanospirillum hungatei]